MVANASFKTPRRISRKSVKDASFLNTEKLFNKTPCSLLRRKSRELIRNARSIIHKNNRNKYIGDRWVLLTVKFGNKGTRVDSLDTVEQ